MAMNPQVLRQLIYPLRKQGDLNLWGTTVLLMKLKVLYNGLLFIFFHSRSSIIAQLEHGVNHPANILLTMA